MTVIDDTGDGTHPVYFEASAEHGFRAFIRHDGRRLYLANVSSATVDPLIPNSILTGSISMALGGLGGPRDDT